jgi:hypothetical protein
LFCLTQTKEKEKYLRNVSMFLFVERLKITLVRAVEMIFMIMMMMIINIIIKVVGWPINLQSVELDLAYFFM